MKLFAVAAAASAVILAAHPAHAVLFGLSHQDPSGTPVSFDWTQSAGGTGGTLTAGGGILFSFNENAPGGVPADLMFTPLAFDLAISAVAPEGNPAIPGLPGQYIQDGLRGSLSLTYAGAQTLQFEGGKTLSTGEVMLSASSIPFSIVSGLVFASVHFGYGGLPGDFSSDVLDLSGDPRVVGSFTLPGGLSASPGQSHDDFTRGLSVYFLAPSGLFYTAVPEPATWGLMILGFGALGTVLRRRRAAAFA